MAAESRHWKHWTEEELDYLADNFGVLLDKTLAGRLQRSEGAIRRKVCRRFHMHRWDNLYNAAELAEALGISHTQRIIRWVTHGWLKARRSSIHRGRYRYWKFSYTGIVRCLKRHPWLVMLKPTRRWLVSDYSHHFFYIVRKEWQRDPWYTTEQAASLLKVTAHTIRDYIHRGLLEAEKTPCRQSSVWVTRRSAIDLFLGGKQKGKEARAMPKTVIPILSKTTKTTKMPDVSGFIRAMKGLGAKVSVKVRTIVIDLRQPRERRQNGHSSN